MDALLYVNINPKIWQPLKLLCLKEIVPSTWTRSQSFPGLFQAHWHLSVHRCKSVPLTPISDSFQWFFFSGLFQNAELCRNRAEKQVLANELKTGAYSAAPVLPCDSNIHLQIFLFVSCRACLYSSYWLMDPFARPEPPALGSSKEETEEFPCSAPCRARVVHKIEEIGSGSSFGLSCMTKWVAHLTLLMLELVLFSWGFCLEVCFFSHKDSRCHLSDWFLEDYVIASCLVPI